MILIPSRPGRNALRGPHRAAYALVGLLCGAFLLAVLWSYTVSIDISATGQGRIVPARQVQVVQNLEGGIVSAILVREGDRVKAGQPVARIQNTEFAATYGEAKENAAGFQAQIARLTAQVEDRPLVFSSALIKVAPELVIKERSLYESRRNELNSTVSSLNEEVARAVNERSRAEQSLPMLAESLRLEYQQKAILQPQVDHGLISKVDVFAVDQKLVEIESKIQEVQGLIPAAKSAEAQAKNKIAAERARFLSEALAQLTEAKVKLSALTQLQSAQKDRVARREVRSPVNGVVNHLNVTTVGEVVRPGDNILQIVPTDDDLIVEARFSPKDIAFIHPGQDAFIRVTAYDSSIYGSLPAKVVQVSADATVTDREEVYYLLRAKSHRSYLGSKEHPLPLIAGMVAQVDIVTSKRTLFDYLLKPLTKIRDTALHER